MSDPAAGTFRDTALPLAKRVSDLLGRLTLAEKIALLHQYQAPVPRLGVSAFHTGTEALHGLAWHGTATVFPQAVGLGASWDPDLVRQVGAATGDEVRARHHQDPGTAGLNVWAPVVNPLRDPRWGRNEEGYSEDPLLTGVLATAYARGLSGDHPRVLKTAPTLKHFLGYNNETRRDTTSSNLPARVLREYELPAFRAPLSAGAAVSVMASYNLVNGRPAHLSPLLSRELPAWCGPDILVVSDAHGCSNVVDSQHYYADHPNSHAAMLRAGLDSFTELGTDGGPTIERIGEAVRLGLVGEDDVDRAAGRCLAIRFRLGEFDPPEKDPYAGTPPEVINCPAHRTLARRAAQESMVLLENRTLPGSPTPLLPLGAIGTLAVLGPLADVVYQDWYSGTLPYAVTARDGLARRLVGTEVRYADGLDRVALATPAGYLVTGPDPDGGPLQVAEAPGARLPAGPPGPEAWFELADWGGGRSTLRVVSNGRYVTVDESGTLTNTAEVPGGWIVDETFGLIERVSGELAPGELVLRHVASGRYVGVEAGVAVAREPSPAAATGLRLELLADGPAEAAEMARGADVAVVVLGNHPMINGRETEDRTDLALPPGQERLLRAVHEANPRTVLVLCSGYPYAIGAAAQRVPAILWSAHGGQEYGNALAAVLSGDVGPAGRLPQTWYRSTGHLPDLLDYDIIASDATYLYYRGAPLYPFGHGLTYSPVDYLDLRLSATEVEPGEQVEVTVSVRNPGDRDTDEVVQVYTRQRRSRVKQPLRVLRGFRRVRLPAGATVPVTFPLRTDDLAFWDVTRDRYAIEEAEHQVLAGRSSADLRCAATLAVRGETVPPRDPIAGPMAAANHDDYAGVTLCDATPVDGDAVVATDPGGWVCLADVDFGGPSIARPSAGGPAGTGPAAGGPAGTGPSASGPAGTGPAAAGRVLSSCAARVSGEGGPAELTLRLDDPLDGPILGLLAVGETEGRYAWIAASTPIEPTSGRHDLFVVFGAAGTRLWDLTFAVD